MTKQNAIETVTSYFEEIDTRALVLDLKTRGVVYGGKEEGVLL